MASKFRTTSSFRSVVIVAALIGLAGLTGCTSAPPAPPKPASTHSRSTPGVESNTEW
jgi:hypothetical protein